ncbi:MAG TPA: prephenate dehydrogenase [Tepidisphaeraceae bacterium]|nr:prephenate dehydrogenase [Tepidisphaeraceae bacterium]
MAIRTLSIIGVGLLGGSIGLAAKERIKDVRVIGYGHRRLTLQRALRLKAIDEAADDLSKAVSGADLVILCTPVGLFRKILTEIRPALAEKCIVTDVGSTKGLVVKWGERIVGRRFVGSHPMAGSEKRGVEFARSDLFDKALCLMTPTARTDPSALRQVEQFWKTLGMKISRLSPNEHDRLLAEVSHLPHIAAAALIGIPSQRAIPLCGKGFLDSTRIAAGDGGLWRDIFLDNRKNMISAIDKLRLELETVANLIEQGDGAKLQRWLDQRARKRRTLNSER